VFLTKFTFELLACCIVLVGILIGFGTSYSPFFVLIPFMLLAVFIILKNGLVRQIFSIFGGLFIFQGISGLGATKIVYLAGLLFVLVGSILNIRKRHSEWKRFRLRPLLTVSTIFGIYVVLSFAFACLQGNSVTDTFRDASPYLLFAIAPLLAVDMALSLSRKAVVFLFAVASAMSLVNFMAAWYANHNIASIGINQIGLYSGMLTASIFSYVTAQAMTGKRAPLLYLLFSGIILAALESTGTRSTFVLLVAPIVIMLISSQRFFVRIGHFVRYLIGLGIIGTIGVIILANVTGANMKTLETRLSSAFQGQKIQYDLSYISRKYQTQETIVEKAMYWIHHYLSRPSSAVSE
jgi:hypothetical protein